MSTTNGEGRPGGGAAFWAALGVRIEPEPQEDAAEAEAGPEGAPPEQVSAAEHVAAEQVPNAHVPVEQVAVDQAAAGEAAAEQVNAGQADSADDADPAVSVAENLVAPAPDAIALNYVAQEANAQESVATTDADAVAADVRVPDQRSAEVEPAVEELMLPARSQASLDEVEPQEGEVVDGLAALNETLAETRRVRENAARPEPAWQLAGELSGALPPLKACLEAILMVVDEPVTDVVLAQVTERPQIEVGAALRELADEYTAQGRGFELREVGIGGSGHGAPGATGWRMYSRPECAPVVERFVRDGQQAKLTQAALETLAVVAYRQPVSRSKVSAIRGVNCDGVMRTLLARGLVEECGTEYETGALLYQTTGYFLERMGLKGLDELPDLAPLLPTAAEVEEEEV